jgi:glutamate/tyrosine decarboxylase-like PLP-dependent enzyme
MAACPGNLAEFRLAQGQMSEAESLAIRSLGMRERSLGTDHPDVAKSLNIVAAILRETDRETAAEALEARIVAIMGTTDGKPDPGGAG